MKSLRHGKDRGIVLKKTRLPNQNVSLTIFSEQSGKIFIFAYGIRTITSRRLSHLESGNYISFSYRIQDDRKYLSETELIFGYSKIKVDELRLQKIYTILQFLHKILPEDEPEYELFVKTMDYFKELNNSVVVDAKAEERFLSDCIEALGYIDTQTRSHQNFDVYDFIQQLTNLKLR
jgi:DNA repair protein RecO